MDSAFHQTRARDLRTILPRAPSVQRTTVTHMDSLLSLFGSVLLLFLTLSGLLLIVAPEMGRRLLKKTAAVFGALLLGLVLIQIFLATMLHPHIGNAIAFWTVSVLAYVYCEYHRRRKHADRPPGTSAERERVDAARVVIEHPAGESAE